MPSYRKIIPTEVGVYVDHLLSLDSRDRYSRFTGTVSDRAIALRCERLDWTRVTLLGAWDGGRLVGVAELCTDRALWPGQAELALSIASDAQGRGIGGQLTRRALNIARNRGIRAVHMLCLADNRRMRALARRFGGSMELDAGEFAVTFPIDAPNHFSLSIEAYEESAGMLTSLLDSLRGLTLSSFTRSPLFGGRRVEPAGDLMRNTANDPSTTRAA